MPLHSKTELFSNHCFIYLQNLTIVDAFINLNYHYLRSINHNFRLSCTSIILLKFLIKNLHVNSTSLHKPILTKDKLNPLLTQEYFNLNINQI